jgi:hypothetical protein
MALFVTTVAVCVAPFGGERLRDLLGFENSPTGHPGFYERLLSLPRSERSYNLSSASAVAAGSPQVGASAPSPQSRGR